MTKISKKKKKKKNCICNLDLGPKMLKRKHVHNIVIPNIAMMSYHKWLMNEVSKAMTKVIIRTYVRTYPLN